MLIKEKDLKDVNILQQDCKVVIINVNKLTKETIWLQRKLYDYTVEFLYNEPPV